MSLFFLFSLS